MEIAHGVDPSLGRVQYLWDGWTIVHDHALEPQCGTVAVHPYWYKEQYLDDAFEFAALFRDNGVHVNALEITEQGHLLFKECFTEVPKPISPGYTVKEG